jgi:hypothetical protein
MEYASMARHSMKLIASALALASVLALAGNAQALERRVRHQHYSASRGGDVVVHTGRSYLDPGTSAEVGSENHYFSDSTSYGGSRGPTFGGNAGFEVLPNQFNPPGRREPLFQF